VNGWTVAGPNQDVRVSTVQGKLMLAGAWLKLKAYAATNPTTQVGEVAQMLLDMCNSPSLQAFQMSDAATYSSVQGMLSELVTDPNTGVTQALETELLALATTAQPWCQANGYRSQISMGDVVMAGLDTSTGYSAQIGAPTSAQFNVQVSVTVTGPKGAETLSTFANTLDADYAKYFAAVAIQNMMTRDASLATF
jgi:hypothetical protein